MINIAGKRFTAGIALSFSLLLSSGCDWFADPTPPLEEGYEYLFDGETLTGWHKIGGDATYTVNGHAIVGKVGPGDNTFLRTDREFGDFILKLQVKFDEPGNSGVMFRAQQSGEASDSPGRAYGYQYELDPSDRAYTGGIYDEARRGWLFDLKDNAEARAAFKANDWNDVQIEAIGGLIKTTINGVAAAELADAMDLSGYIALQVHAGNEGIIRWRNIRIKELGQHAWETAGLVEPDAWKIEGTDVAFIDKQVSFKVGDATSASMTSRRQLSDFAVRFDIPSCVENASVTLRGVDADQGVAVELADNAVNLRLLGKDNEVNGTVELEKPQKISLNVTAVGESLTASVNNQLLGRIQGGIPDRGKLSIETDPCEDGKIEVNNMQWVNLRRERKEKLFYETLDTPPAPVLSPEQAADSFRIAPGFKIELVASEPLMAAPVAMAWDEDGRLFVVEMRGFMPDAYGDGQEEVTSRVVMLEDTDADGQMDSSKVVLDDLHNPRAVAVINEGILIGEPPNLWLCKTPLNVNAEQLCANKIRLGDFGAGENEKNIEHMENALLPGLDNWYYSANSTRRIKVDNGKLVEDPTVNRGQWGITKDNEGRIYHNNNSVFINGDFFPAEYVLATAGTQGATGIGASVSLQEGQAEEVFSIRVNPGVNRAYLDGTLKEDGRLAAPTAVSGLTVYRGGLFPDEHANTVFVPEPAGNAVAQFRLVEEGIAVQAEHLTYEDGDWGQREFLASTDERFRPVDAAVGPDGALYIIDMYRGIIQDQAFMTDELREQVFERGLDKPIDRGRIWRVTYSEEPARDALPQLSTAQPSKLVAMLSHANGWMRDTAQRMLATQPASADSLQRLAKSGKGLGATHALWTLQAQGKLDRDTALAALSSSDESVQLQALRAGMDVLTLEDLLAQTKKLQDGSEKLRHQLVFNLAPHNREQAAQVALLDILTSDADNAYFPEAVVNSIMGTELGFLKKLLEDERWSAESKNRAGVIKMLSAGAYLALRGDTGSTATAPAKLLQILTLAGEQTGASRWRQIAMLQGFKEISAREGFVPAQLATAPALFSDSSITEDDPLWDARLQGRRAFTWPGDEIAAGLKPLGPQQLALVEKGKVLYKNCAACHGANGQGSAGLAPTLVGTSWVLGPPEWLVRIVLHGISGELEIEGKTWNSVMPGHGAMPDFDDESIAGLLTHIRRSWGNTEDPIESGLVAQVRQETASREKTWTAKELEKVPFEKGYEHFAGKYKVSFMKFTVTAEADALHLKVPMYGGGPMQQLDDTTFIANTGGEKIKLEFEVAADGSVPAMLLLRDGQKIRAERVQ